jgi:hypothetical protein
VAIHALSLDRRAVRTAIEARHDVPGAEIERQNGAVGILIETNDA